MNALIFAILMVLPWLATFSGSMLGANMGFSKPKRQAQFLGFAAGVMIAASVWSLIVPAFDGLANLTGVLVNTVGFALGCGLMLLLDHILPHTHQHQESTEGVRTTLSRPMLLVMAVALHNIPEGIALGILIAGSLGGQTTVPAALAFAFGLALQNFPEGMAVVVPLRQAGISKKRCYIWGTLASFAEPMAALLGLGSTLLVTGLNPLIMPLLLSVAGGAMIFIVVEELIPESQVVAEDGHAATFGFVIGFWSMAIMGILGG